MAWRELAVGALTASLAGAGAFRWAPRSGARVQAPSPSSATSPEVKLDLPPAARSIVTARCVMCHGSLLILEQRLTRDEWAAEVAKMKGWGAPIEDDEIATLVDALAAREPPGAPPLAPARIDTREVLGLVAPQASPWPAGSRERGALLYATNCQLCHGPAGEGNTGPALAGRTIAQRPAAFDKVVREGRGNMPGFGAPFPGMEVADLFAWVSR